MDLTMDSQLLFSIIAPAYRNKMYQDVYDSLSKNNNLSFEMIFVGHRPPEKKMPENFKYIFTTVKPSQCLEIAARKANGKFIMMFPDDCIASGNLPYVINSYISKLDMNKYCIVPSWSWRGRIRTNNIIFLDAILKYPVGTCCILKKIWNDVGGMDRRFFGILCFADFYFRLIKMNINTYILRNCHVTEIDPLYDKDFAGKINKGTRYTNSSIGKTDNELLKNLWTYDGVSSHYRNSLVEPFSDDNILEVSQGPNMIIPR